MPKKKRRDGQHQTNETARVSAPKDATTQLATQEVAMEPQDATVNPEIAQQQQMAEALQKAKGEVDLELVLLCFSDEFAEDPLVAGERLLDLLLDPITCEARIAVLEKTAKLDVSRRLRPGGWLSPARSYIRELLWLANGQLRQAIETETACLEYLCQMASNPGTLRLAHRTLMMGNEVLLKIVMEHQAAAWCWLRQEVCAGRLQKDFGGKYVAVWQADQPYREFEVGVDQCHVRAAASKRWLVPEDLLAVTNVDED